MFSVWKLKKPNLVISVTGGAQKLNIDPKLRNIFCDGVVKAAYSTSN